MIDKQIFITLDYLAEYINTLPEISISLVETISGITLFMKYLHLSGYGQKIFFTTSINIKEGTSISEVVNFVLDFVKKYNNPSLYRKYIQIYYGKNPKLILETDNILTLELEKDFKRSKITIGKEYPRDTKDEYKDIVELFENELEENELEDYESEVE